MAAAERAKAAALDADVREIDIAVDYISYPVTHLLTADVIGGGHRGSEFSSGNGKQQFALVDAHFAAGEHLFKNAGDGRVACRHRSFRLYHRSSVGRTSPDSSTKCATRGCSVSGMKSIRSRTNSAYTASRSRSS